MEAWCSGRIRIYSPTDLTDRFITMPDHIHWPLLTPSEEQNIRVILSRPWILDGQSFEGLRDDQIDEFDAIMQFFAEAERVPLTFQRHQRERVFETLLRPTLMMEMSLTLVPLQPSLDRMAKPPPAFPKHLTDQVLASVEAAGQTCPITMEPIKKASAAITSCGHVFQKTAISHWMQNHDTCPECRQPCTI
jgi:hypothetical protein